MKLVSILGSPHSQGNGGTITSRFTETAAKLGAEVRQFELNNLNYRGCQACYKCKTTLDRCGLSDDLTQVLEAIRDTDTVLISSPIYMSELPGPVKSMIDRTFSFLPPDFLSNPNASRVSGKKVVLIITHGAPGQAYAEVGKRYENVLKLSLGLKEFHFLEAGGLGPMPIAIPDEYLQKAEHLARTVMSAN